MATIGCLEECPGEITFKWTIEKFFSLPEDVDVHYQSPKFYFSGSSWSIKICPNGEKKYESVGYIGIYVKRMSSGLPLSITFSLGLKTNLGKIHSSVVAKQVFGEKDFGWGNPKLISRKILIKKRSELAPLNTLTVLCTLKNHESQNVIGSLFSRQLEICDNLKEIYEKSMRTDFILKVDEEDISAHKVFLETRSPVFAAMFNHDTKENQTGEVSIEDIDINTMRVILEYMYCGDFEKLTTENVISIYFAADKYDIMYIKEVCLNFIKTNLSIEWVCDVIRFADLYQLEEINSCAREYFKSNVRKILDTENWKIFAKENHNLSVELLGLMVKTLVPE